MEILNKNQRNRGIWRLVGLGVIVLMLLGAGAVQTHQQYQGQGRIPLEDCQEEVERLKRQLASQRSQFTSDNGFLLDTIRQLREAAMEPDEMEIIRQERVKNTKKEIQDLKEEVRDLKTDLAACNSRVDNLTKIQ